MTTLEKLEKLVYQSSKEADRRSKKTDLQLQEVARRQEELARRQEETDRQLKEIGRHLHENAEETDKALKETDKAIKQLTREVAGLTQNLSGLTDSLGKFAESAVYPAVAKLFRERGIKLNHTYWRIGDRSNGYQMEADVVGIGPKHAILIEVKLKLKLEHVKELLEKLDKFFDVFTYFKGRTLYGAVAGMTVDKGVDRFAYKHGLFVMAQTGDNLAILNDPTFVPQKF